MQIAEWYILIGVVNNIIYSIMRKSNVEDDNMYPLNYSELYSYGLYLTTFIRLLSFVFAPVMLVVLVVVVVFKLFKK